MKRRSFIHGAGAAAILPMASCMDVEYPSTPAISTSAGKVRGEIVDGIHRFLGIPFAEPPFGHLRWMPPEPRAAWENTLPATTYGAICPQTGGISVGLPEEGEDCLSLNIWTPDPSTRNLPVMIWAHGGGQVSGSGANQLYDGTHFARDGVVLVTANRRIGAEGYLYLEERFGDGVGPGNLGIQDLLLTVTWVVENIEGFGGNPNNITVFGESGGAAAVQALVATPGAEQLISKVILQSGGHAAQRTDTATAITDEVLKQVSVSPGDLERLRKVPWQQFVSVYPTIEDQEHLGQPQIYLPVISQHMPTHPVDATHQGMGTELDFMIGTCRDEARLFSALTPDLYDSIFYRRAKKVIEQSGQAWIQVAQAYKRLFPDLDDKAIDVAIMGDMWFRIPALRIAAGHARASEHNTFMYLFEWESPFIGAAHAMDLMVFGNGIPFSFLAGFRDYEKTARFMRRSWISFASHGSPGDAWPAYGPSRATMSIDETQDVLIAPYDALSKLLEPVIASSWLRSGL